jgi:hypothetical protein
MQCAACNAQLSKKPLVISEQRPDPHESAQWPSSCCPHCYFAWLEPDLTQSQGLTPYYANPVRLRNYIAEAIAAAIRSSGQHLVHILAVRLCLPPFGPTTITSPTMATLQVSSCTKHRRSTLSSILVCFTQCQESGGGWGAGAALSSAAICDLNAPRSQCVCHYLCACSLHSIPLHQCQLQIAVLRVSLISSMP